MTSNATNVKLHHYSSAKMLNFKNYVLKFGQTLPEISIPKEDSLFTLNVNASNDPWNIKGGIINSDKTLRTFSNYEENFADIKKAAIPSSTVNPAATDEILKNYTFNVLNDYDCINNNSILCSANESEEERNLWALVLLLFPFATIFGNILVIRAVYAEKNLQSVTNYFISSLAIADLLVAALVMPFFVYYTVNTYWGLPPYICDCYIGMDVICSTSSILNLVAISIDRYIAVTKPIKYAQHKSNSRIIVTIAFVWAVSVAIGIPIMAGLNDEGRHPGICAFNNAIFIISSSIFSFYIPCLIMVYLYFRIFKAIRKRGRKKIVKRQRPGEVNTTTIYENVAQTKQFAETKLNEEEVPPKTYFLKPPQIDEDQATSCTTNSQDDEEAVSHVDTDKRESEIAIRVPPKSNQCHIIQNPGNEDILRKTNNKNERKDEENQVIEIYIPTTNVEIVEHEAETAPQIEHGFTNNSSTSPINREKPNGESTSSPQEEGEEEEDEAENRPRSSNNPFPPMRKISSAGRFKIYKTHKTSKRKREKSSAKRERKATKTLAIVLGAFLFCWVPFFTCNILDAMHKLLDIDALDPGANAFLFTTWLGYMNSFLNPVIYTIFNPEFRKAFKKILLNQY